ncbi:MAG: hypothetical protein COT15_04500 [Candidatus Diapherotrites archaeon CG08_land_8_20_14_0_20_34_12]|nr:MAG: hypothetical protein COT15_04500 [Candidatus Diapherotrites archaeon CG08_land_8_20_14_0_20_34_12]
MPRFQAARKARSVLKRPAQRFSDRQRAKQRGLHGLTDTNVLQLKDRISKATRLRDRTITFEETGRDAAGREEAFHQAVSAAKFLLEAQKEDVFRGLSDIAIGLALDRLGLSQKYDAAKRAEVERTFKPFVDRALSLYKKYEISGRQRIPEEDIKSLYREAHESVALLIGFRKAVTFVYAWDKNVRRALLRYREEPVGA